MQIKFYQRAIRARPHDADMYFNYALFLEEVERRGLVARSRAERRPQLAPPAGGPAGQLERVDRDGVGGVGGVLGAVDAAAPREVGRVARPLADKLRAEVGEPQRRVAVRYVH